MANFIVSQIKGVIPAMLTVFDENEKVDEQGIRSLTEHLISKRIDGLYLTGSTGESFLMTGDERKKVVETVTDQVKGRVPVIVHVGDIGTLKSIDNAVHAYEAGADAISSVPPFYWNFTQKQVFNYYKDLSESTPLPMIVYNVKMAGVIGLETIKELALIENVKGIKYTLTSHFEMQQIKERLGDDFILYSGCDQMAASGLLMGADGL